MRWCFRLFTVAALFVTVIQRSKCGTSDKVCDNVQPFNIYPTFGNFSCYVIEDRIDPTSSFDRIAIAQERGPLRATSPEDFLDKISLVWGDEKDSVAFHTVNFRGQYTVYNRMNFSVIQQVHKDTYTCPGSYIRFYENYDQSICVHVKFGKNVPSFAERFWSKSQFCKSGSRGWISETAMRYGSYAVYPEVYRCPTLDIVFPENGVISALPGDTVSFQLEVDDFEVNEYTISCDDEEVPNATISESGIVSWNVPADLGPDFQACAECEIETNDGHRRYVNITFEIFHCDCSGHGTCILANNATQGLGDYLCKCDNGYEGSRCENDIDECASNPCYPNVLCVNFNAMYWCMDCPPGMEGDGIDCTEKASTTESETLTTSSTSSTLLTSPSTVDTDLTTTTEPIDLVTHSNATKPRSSDSSSTTSISSTTQTPAVTDDATKTFVHFETLCAMLLFAIGANKIALSP